MMQNTRTGFLGTERDSRGLKLGENFPLTSRSSFDA